MSKRTKKVVIKEELVELTGDYKLAIVLNQMIYWSERVADFDQFIKEEQERQSAENNSKESIEYNNGWIYKKADELADECMITGSEATMRRYLDKLVSDGFLSTRRNPKFKWDKTLQYRVNIRKIQKELFKLGYHLEGYKYLPFTENQNESSNFQNDESNFQNENTNFHNENPNFHDERAIPEITTESTSEIKKEEEEARKENPFHFFEENGFGVIGGHMHEKINAWCDDLSDELVLEAMKLAVERSVKKWSYVESILRDWSDKGIQSVSQVHAAIKAFKEQQSKQRGNYKPSNQPKRKEYIPDWYEETNPTNQTNPPTGEDVSQKKKALEERLKKYKKDGETSGST